MQDPTTYRNGYGYSDAPRTNAEDDSDTGLSFSQIWWMLVRLRWWLLLSVGVCMVVAFCYLRYTTPRYEVFAKFLIKDQERRQNNISSTLNELGMMNSSTGFDNEIEVLKTRTLNSKVVRGLKLYVRYVSEGRMRDTEIYGLYSPYLVDIDASSLDSLSRPIGVRLEGAESGLLITTIYTDLLGEKREDQHLAQQFPVTISTPYGRVSVSRNPTVEASARRREAAAEEENREWTYDPFALSHPLNVTIFPLMSSTAAYVGRLSILSTSEATSIARVTMVDNIVERAKDYLTRLLYEYNEDATLDKSAEARRTAEFIDERLGIISLELGTSEETLEQYKVSTGITDVSTDASIGVSQSLAYEQQLVSTEQQIALVDYLIDYVANPANRYKVIPSNVGLTDATLTPMFSSYNEAVITRDNLLRTLSENSPQVTSITSQLDGYMTAIQSSLRSTKSQLAMQRSTLRGQQNKYAGKVSSAPTKERAMAEITRQQEVKAGLYLMLLQKREETALTLASTAYKGKLIEEPLSAGPVFPRKQRVLLMALIIGLAIPIVIMTIKQLLKFRVESSDDIQRLTDAPLLGSVPLVKQLLKSQRAVVIQENRNSLMMEVFRSLRMNLPFVLEKGQNVILFTSTNPGEGKTVICSNLGASLAIAGKRTVIVGGDIRKPRLASLFNLSESSKGLSDFLSRDPDDTSYIDKLIQPSGIHACLDILPAGTIPPNPAELLERDNLAAALDYLRTKYDYVLVDSAPIGVVADTLTVAKHCHLCLYVVRCDYTLKSDIDMLNDLRANGRLSNVNIILNAEKASSGGSGYGYGKRYGYGKKYGYGYGKRYGYGYGKRYGYGYGHGYGYGYGDGRDKDEALPEI